MTSTTEATGLTTSSRVYADEKNKELLALHHHHDEADSSLDMIAGLSYLYSTKHNGVREYVVSKFEDLPEEEVEFFIPQLCHLFSNLKSHEGSEILEFLAARCSKSAHFCLKSVLTIQSAVENTNTRDQKQRYTELWRCCEGAFVNAHEPANKMPRTRSCLKLDRGASVKTHLRNQSLHDVVREDHFVANKENDRKSKLMSDGKYSQDSTPPKTKKPSSQERPLSAESAVQKKPEPLALVSKPSESAVGIPREDSLDAETSCSKFHPTSGSPSDKPKLKSADTVKERERQVMLYKRRIFLRAQFQLLADLAQISEVLLKVRRKSRQQCLSACLQKLNRKIPPNVYLPWSTMDSKHFVIRRFIPEAARSLNSRDKAPYMLFIEILYTGKSCGDDDVFSCDMTMEDAKSNLNQQNGKKEMSQLARTVDELKKTYGSKFTGAEFSKCIRKFGAKIKMKNGVKVGDANDLELLCRQLTNNILASRLVVEDGKTESKDSAPRPEDFIIKPRATYKIAGNDSGSDRSSRPDPFGTPWRKKKSRYKKDSPVGMLKNWDLISVIYKGGDDLRQEVLAMQLIKMCDKIFSDAGLPLQLTPYEVMVTSANSGLIETVHNATSIDGLKGDWPNFTSLADFFEGFYGQRGTSRHEQAQRNFVESMAAYSLVTYIFAIKDRHNGNIMLDREGRIIHIDFGFMLNNSPGGNSNFESSPFKLTQEYVEVMEGEDSKAFAYFKLMFIRGLLELRKHVCKFELTIQMMMDNSNMACFAPTTIQDFRSRFGLDLDDGRCVEFAISLVETSINNWRSVQYDEYQRITNGKDEWAASLHRCIVAFVLLIQEALAKVSIVEDETSHP
eukprot:CAMPEP_0114501480 /NCGR_PEP_ID=MMETSP0109-20121206/8518_1 /TAXON_ID=29199 /ORGANISM="Chlorarachnion reptans, Strain CCCM449" /LENGTH=845 /DNA_ID=CAMNT_0001679207 /DNA_START=129 /DNA_END=2663 /DNA_ORIENTATION=+